MVKSPPEIKPIGLYWGHKALYFTEAVDAQATQMFTVSLEADKFNEKDILNSSNASTLTSRIKNSFRQYGLSPTSVNLSLPTKDIIFRSFIIPWMKSSEIKGVVEFEATKYVPFTLDDLIYSYHPVTVSEATSRRLRIIFVAIKKDIYNNYLNIIEKAQLSVAIAEPAPMSLIRTLIMKKLLPNEMTAVIEKDHENAKILIVADGIPHFIREFQIKLPVANQLEDTNKTLTHFINEVRISLDYFNRQEARQQIKQVLVISENNELDVIVPQLEKTLSTPTKSLPIRPFLGNNISEQPNYLYSYGVSVRDSINTPVSFELSRKPLSKIKTRETIIRSNFNYTSVGTTLLLCLALLGGSYYTSKQSLIPLEEKREVLNKKLGKNKSTTKETFQSNIKSLKDKLSSIKGLRKESHVSAFLTIIPELLPKGVWLKSLEFIYPEFGKEALNIDPKTKRGKTVKSSDAQWPTLDISGNVYTPDVNNQIPIVNELVRNLRRNKDLAKVYPSIESDSMREQKINDLTTTFFKIKCRP